MTRHQMEWVIPFFISSPPPPTPRLGRHNLILSRRTLSKSNILTTIKGFGISILPTRTCQKLRLYYSDYYKACGNWAPHSVCGDKEPVGIMPSIRGGGGVDKKWNAPISVPVPQISFQGEPVVTINKK